MFWLKCFPLLCVLLVMQIPLLHYCFFTLMLEFSLCSCEFNNNPNGFAAVKGLFEGLYLYACVSCSTLS